MKTIKYDDINTIKDLELFIDENLNLGLLEDKTFVGMLLSKLEELRRSIDWSFRFFTIVGFLLGCGFMYFLLWGI